MANSARDALSRVKTANPYYGQFGEDRDRDRGTGGLNTALMLGGLGLAGGLAHSSLMGSNSPFAHKYKDTLGRPIREMGNSVRSSLGMPALEQPLPARLERLKELLGQASATGKAALGAVPVVAGGALGLKKMHDSAMGGTSRLDQIYQDAIGHRLNRAGNRVADAVMNVDAHGNPLPPIKDRVADKKTQLHMALKQRFPRIFKGNIASTVPTPAAPPAGAHANAAAAPPAGAHAAAHGAPPTVVVRRQPLPKKP